MTCTPLESPAIYGMDDSVPLHLRKGWVKAPPFLTGCTAIPIKGLGLGTRLGYPTINLKPIRRLKLNHGVYGCQARIKRHIYDGILYYGPKYIVDNQLITLELHILKTDNADFEALYNLNTNSKISLIIGAFIRKPKKLITKKAIKDQIKKDINKFTRTYANKMWKNKPFIE